METIPTVRGGDAVEAELFNRIAHAAMRTGKLRVGRGLVARIGRGGLTIDVDFEAFRNRSGWMESIITAVGGGAGPDIGSTFTYSVRVMGRPDLPEYTGLTPTCGRPVRASDTTTEIYPCAEGDPCFLRRRPTGDGDGTSTPELWVGTEVYALEDCGAGAVSQPDDLSLLFVLDAILTDRSGDPLTDRRGRLLGDRRINDAQAAEFLDPVLTDRRGRILTDRRGRALLDRSASESCIALWDAALTDRRGEPLTDRRGRILLDRTEN